MKSRRAYIEILAVLLVAGCAATVPPAEKRDIGAVSPAPPVEERVASPRLFDDRDLLFEGIALLNRPGRPDPAKAREVFASFLKRYPQSQWRSAAETFIRLIDEGEASREAGRKDRLLRDKLQAEQARVLQENDNLKKTARELKEKLQAEAAALTQENEQLKKDLQRLKLLEIELQKRERMLR